MFIFGEDIVRKERVTVKSDEVFEVLGNDVRKPFDFESWSKEPRSKTVTYHRQVDNKMHVFCVFDAANSEVDLSTTHDSNGKRYRTPKRMSNGPCVIDLQPFKVKEERQQTQDVRKTSKETKKKAAQDQQTDITNGGNKGKRKKADEDEDAPSLKKVKEQKVIDVQSVKKVRPKRKKDRSSFKVVRLSQEAAEDTKLVQKATLFAKGAHGDNVQKSPVHLENPKFPVLNGEEKSPITNETATVSEETESTGGSEKPTVSERPESPPEEENQEDHDDDDDFDKGAPYYACDDLKCQDSLNRALQELSITTESYYTIKKQFRRLSKIQTDVAKMETDMEAMKQFIVTEIREAVAHIKTPFADEVKKLVAGGLPQQKSVQCKLKDLKDVSPLSDEEDGFDIPESMVHIGDKKLLCKKAIAKVEKDCSGLRSRLFGLAKLFWPAGDHINWSMKKGYRTNQVPPEAVHSMIQILGVMKWSKQPDLTELHVKRELGKALSEGDKSEEKPAAEPSHQKNMEEETMDKPEAPVKGRATEKHGASVKSKGIGKGEERDKLKKIPHVGNSGIQNIEKRTDKRLESCIMSVTSAVKVNGKEGNGNKSESDSEDEDSDSDKDDEEKKSDGKKSDDEEESDEEKKSDEEKESDDEEESDEGSESDTENGKDRKKPDELLLNGVD